MNKRSYIHFFLNLKVFYRYKNDYVRINVQCYYDRILRLHYEPTPIIRLYSFSITTSWVDSILSKKTLPMR